MLFHIKMGQGSMNGLHQRVSNANTKKAEFRKKKEKQNLGEQIKLFVIFIF